MIISCKCQSAQSKNSRLKVEINVDLALLPTAHRALLASGSYQWVTVATLERTLGLRRKVVHDLIEAGELISYEIPVNQRTKYGYGSRAFVAVKTYPCPTCCPKANEVDWDYLDRSLSHEF